MLFGHESRFWHFRTFYLTFWSQFYIFLQLCLKRVMAKLYSPYILLKFEPQWNVVSQKCTKKEFFWGQIWQFSTLTSKDFRFISNKDGRGVGIIFKIFNTCVLFNIGEENMLQGCPKKMNNLYFGHLRPFSWSCLLAFFTLLMYGETYWNTNNIPRVSQKIHKNRFVWSKLIDIQINFQGI